MENLYERYNALEKSILLLERVDVNRIQTLSFMSYSDYFCCFSEGINILPIKECLQLSNKAILAAILALEIFLEKGIIKQNEALSKELDYFPNDCFYNLLFLSQNRINYKKFAQLVIERDEAIRNKRNNKIFEWPEVFLALSYFILDDKINFEYHLERAKLSKTKSASLKGYIEMISGIANKDENLFHAGVNLQLQWFKRNRESRESIGYPYNFPVMGFINLARFKGMNIELESPHIHPKLIEELPPDFIYEGIPEVYKALEIAENKKNGVMGKLKNWFS